MSKYYADYAYEWKNEHPIQTFLMGIETSKDWKSFGSDSDYYYNKPEEAGMLALTPFKSGSHIFGFVAYVFILIMLFCSVYYMQFSFDTMMYLCGAFTLCHCVYMYYFTSLPRMKDENLRKKHTLSELILIVGLFLPLSLMYLNYQNQVSFNAWVAKYELVNKYSKTALMEVYQSTLENDEVEERAKIREDITELRKRFNIKDPPVEDIHKKGCPMAKKEPSKKIVQHETVTKSGGITSTHYTYSIQESYQP